MSETEKQEGQKTVVAFIAGLLIGGLLVWVFSSAPEQTETEKVKETNTEATVKNEGTTKTETTETKTETTETTKTETKVSTIKAGDAKLKVADQAAGVVVTLTESTYPTNGGWVVVRDYMDGVPGNILGAARFNTDEGLTPTSVNLLRATAKGNSYQVVYYSDNGDKVFDLGDDLVIEGVSASFKAQ